MALVTTAVLLEAVIGGCIGNRADQLLTFSARFLRQRLLDTMGEPQNHDIQRAVRKAYLNATLVACDALRQAKYPSWHDFLTQNKQRSNLAGVVAYLRQEIRAARANQWMPSSELDPYPLEELLKELRGKGLLGLTRSREVDLIYQDFQEALPEEVVAAMYDLSGLGEGEKVLLSRIAILPPEKIPFTLLKELVLDVEGHEELLPGLAQKGWIEFDKAEKSFKWSPVIQEVIREKNQSQLWDDSESMVDQLIHLLEYQPGTGHLENTSYEKAADLVRFSEAVIRNLDRIDNKLGTLLRYMGSYYTTTGKLEDALRCYGAYQKLEQALSQAYPENENYKNNLAISYEKLGETYSSLGQLEEALKYFEKFKELMLELYEAYPTNVSFKNGLAISYIKLYEIHQKQNELQVARGYLLQSEKHYVELVAIAPQYAVFQRNLDWVRKKLEKL